MGGTINVAGHGLDKKTLIGVGAAAGGIVVFSYWRKRKSAKAAPPELIDPLTGLPGDANSGVGPGAPYANPHPVTSIDTTPGSIKSDQDWARTVESKMIDLGYSSTAIADVLGKYLARQALSVTEAATIRIAWGFVGKPPGNQPILLVQTAPTPTPVPAPRPTPTPTPTPVKPSWINVFGSQGVDDFIHTMNGLGVPITYAELVRLNPELPKWISWKQKAVPGHPGQYTHQDNVFSFNTALRIK